MSKVVPFKDWNDIVRDSRLPDIDKRVTLHRRASVGGKAVMDASKYRYRLIHRRVMNTMGSGIECIWCSKELVLPKKANKDDFAGDILCHECQALLFIKLKKSLLTRYSLKEHGRIKIDIAYDGSPKPRETA